MSARPDTDYRQEGRYLATVMVVNVQGFSALVGLDARVEMGVIKETWLRIDRTVAEMGGNLVKHTGDTLLAVWGLPTAGDNDPEQAVKAALALQDMIQRTHSAVVPESSKFTLQVGIHTGNIYAMQLGVNNEYALVGEAVSQAYRLADRSQPGMILIDEDTFHQVHGAFQMQRYEAEANAYQVEEVKATAGKARYGGAETMQTRMVAREQEMSQLSVWYAEAMQSGRPLLVLVEGESGIGKSRLLMEFTSQMEAEIPAFYLMASRALAQTERVPFYLWKTLWQNRFGVLNTDTPAAAGEKFLREVQRLWGRSLGPVPVLEAVHLTGSLIGLDWPGSPYLARFAQDALGRVNRGYEMTSELMRRTASTRPTVLVLDDLQWADQDSLDLLGFVMASSSEDQPLPLLVLGAARPGFAEQHPGLAQEMRLITLQPLPMSGETVAAAYPYLRGLPEHMLASLASVSGGNPYFLEEIVRSILKSNDEDSEDAMLEMLARLRAQPPESLEAMLRSRLSDLARMARAAAMLAAISGRVFWVGGIQAAVRAMVGKQTNMQLTLPSALAEQTIEEGLRQLVRAELAFPRANSSFTSDQEYIFKHDLLRDVAYNLVPANLRKVYHFAVGNWLAGHEDLEFIIMATDQFEMAGAFNEAMAQCEKAATLLEKRGAVGEAQMIMERSRLIHTNSQSSSKEKERTV